MATETFTWCPQIDPVGEVQHRTLRAQFGDGYAQVAADGINARSESWPLSFTGRLTTIAPLREFLDRHGGWRAFLWTPPAGQSSQFRASAYQLRAHGGGIYTLTVTFTEAHKP